MPPTDLLFHSGHIQKYKNSAAYIRDDYSLIEPSVSLFHGIQGLFFVGGKQLLSMYKGTKKMKIALFLIFITHNTFRT